MHKGRARREEPQHCAGQVFRITKAAHRSVVNDSLPSWRKLTSSLVGQEKAILLGKEKARGNRVDPDLIRILLRHVDRQPLGEIADRRLGR